MTGVFLSRDNRTAVKSLFAQGKIEIQLFKPDFTDDESEDHDCSEEESQEDGTTSHSSQEEKSEKSKHSDDE